MKEIIENHRIIRPIVSKSLMEAVGKAMSYVLMFPPDYFGTKMVSAKFDKGVYRINLERDRYD